MTNVFPSMNIRTVPNPYAWASFLPGIQKTRTIYQILQDVVWRDPVTGKTITAPMFFEYDGTTHGTDAITIGPLIHDVITGCKATGYKGRWCWDDGSPITTRESRRILKTISGDQDGQEERAKWWNRAVYLLGPRSPHG